MAAEWLGSNEMDVFDPLSEDRAGDPEPTRTTLRQRGQSLKLLREEQRRKEAYSAKTRCVSNAMLGAPGRKPQSSRRLLVLANESSTPSVSVSDALGVIPDNSVAESPVAVGGDESTLTKSAVLALWTNFRLAMGFRRWREATMGSFESVGFFNSTDINGEARRILTNAEATRLAAVLTAKTATVATASDEDELVVSPRALDTAGIRLSRPELDVLQVWAKQIQAKTFRGVDDASVCEVMRFLRFRSYQDGDSLFYEGESGETFYLIFQGTVAVFVGMHPSVKAKLSSRRGENGDVRLDWSQLGRRVFTYRTADSFGETAMFSDDATRTASAVAVGPCEVCELHRDVYRRTLRKYHQQFFEQAQKLNFLQRVPLFRELQRPKLTMIADVLEKKRFCFGDTIVTERSSVLDACYLVLSGAVKLTQGVEVPSSANRGMNPVEIAAMSAPTGKQKKKQVVHIKMELHTVVSNEIVALEALLDPHNSPHASYSATVASAHVEVFVLKESDARQFIGGAQSAMGQRIRQICENEATHRERRRKYAKETLLSNIHDAGEVEDTKLSGRKRQDGNNTSGDSVDLAAAMPDSPRRNKASHCDSGIVPGLQVARVPAISAGAAPYLPNLRATHLFPGSRSLTLSPRDARGPLVPNDLSVVSSPKMLSSCVRKFLFQNSDTLAGDYVERLSHQFPSPPAPVVPGGLTSRTDREQQRVLDQQLTKMYDSKMHWDAKKKDFVLGGREVSGSGGGRAGFLSSTPRSSTTKDFVAPVAPFTSRPPSGEAAGGGSAHVRKTSFQQELRSTQQVARKLVENHMKRIGHKQQNQQTAVAASGDANGGASFLHFFADA